MKPPIAAIEPPEVDAAERIADAVVALRNLLARGPLTVFGAERILCKEMHCTTRDVQAACKVLGIEPVRRDGADGSFRGWWLQLPEAGERNRTAAPWWPESRADTDTITNSSSRKRDS